MDTPHDIVCVYTRVSVRVCSHVCARVTREISFVFQDNTTLPIAHVLYMH